MNEAALEYAIQVLEERLSELRGAPKHRLNIPSIAPVATAKRGRPAGRKLSAAAKEAIRAGQQRRWAEKARQAREASFVVANTVDFTPLPETEAATETSPDTVLPDTTPKKGKKKGAGS